MLTISKALKTNFSKQNPWSRKHEPNSLNNKKNQLEAQKHHVVFQKLNMKIHLISAVTFQNVLPQELVLKDHYLRDFQLDINMSKWSKRMMIFQTYKMKNMIF